MKRVVLVLALVASCACTNQQRRASERTEGDAVAALRRGDFASAQTIAERGLEQTRAQPDSNAAWTFRLIRAESLVLQQKVADAREALAREIPAASEFETLRARKKYVEARALLAEGRLRDALDAVEAGRGLSASRDVRFDLDVLGGQLRLRLGRQAEAESVLQAVVANAGAAGDRYHQALALNDLGMGRLVRNRFDDALPWFERVLSLRDLESLRIYAQSLNNAGICYNELGEFDRAVALQRRAVQIHERHGLTKSFEQALGELGRTYLTHSDPAQALPPLQRAFEVASTAHITDDAGVWAGSLAQAHIDLGQWDEAARFNDEAIRMRRAAGTGRLMWNTFFAATIAAGRGHAVEASNLYRDAIAASADEPAVRWQATAGLARVALAEGRSDRAREYFERALSIIEQTRSTLSRADYKLSYFYSLMRVYQEYVDSLLRDGRIEQALEVADSSRARVLAERHGTPAAKRVSVRQFRDIARRSERVLLFYWLGAKQSYMWTVTPDAVHGAALPPAAEIEALVRDHRRTIDSALADPLAGDTAGDKLYRLLVEPAARWLPAGASVLIVPDGALHALNFETLPVGGERRRFWIEDADIQVGPSLGLLTADSRAPDRMPSLLLIGAPAAHDPDFPPLRYASAEMTRIAGHFDKDRVVAYEGARASPAAFSTAEPARYSIIHFAAHAAANVESPLDSAVILSAAPDGNYKLYARDVAQTPLDADLVTVSACRGAGERAYSGEGLIGFAWAFLRAGARRVIAGLWDVDDRSTADLMDALYLQLASGVTPSQALRAAKLSMLKRGGATARPYYWGAFELFTLSP